jgi:hypothetical protein
MQSITAVLSGRLANRNRLRIGALANFPLLCGIPLYMGRHRGTGEQGNSGVRACASYHS